MEAKEKQLFYRYILLTAVVCGSILCLVFALRDYFPGQKITFTYGDYYAQFYRNTFQHGGISMEEMLIPLVTLQPK